MIIRLPVSRNVPCSAILTRSKLHAQAYQFAKAVSEHLIPQTTAYHEIWLDKKVVAGDAVKKIAVVVPPSNDVDAFASDVGFIAIADEEGGLAGFNVTAGGGMGLTSSDFAQLSRVNMRLRRSCWFNGTMATMWGPFLVSTICCRALILGASAVDRTQG